MYLIFKEGKFRVLDNSAKICSSRNYSETLNLRNWLNLNPAKYLKSLSLQKLVSAKISSLNIICLTKKAPYVKMWNKSKPVNSISDSSTILHCLKSFQIRSYFWSVFGHFLRIENLWRLLAFGFHFHTLYSSYYFIYHHTQMTVYVDFKKHFSLRQDFLMLVLLSCWSLSHPFPPIHLRTYQLLQDLKSWEQLLQYFSHKRLFSNLPSADQ